MWRQSHGQSNIRGSINTKSSSSIHPSAAAAAVQRRGAEQDDAVAAVTSDRWQCSRASEERPEPHPLLLLLVVVVVGVAHGSQQTAVQWSCQTAVQHKAV